MTEDNTCENIATFGFSDIADYHASKEHLISKPGYLGVHFQLDGKCDLQVDVAIPGKFSVYNALAAITACSYFPVKQEQHFERLGYRKSEG
ncbi:MAG: Mur ligase family protein [Eubacteriales bacterium]